MSKDKFIRVMSEIDEQLVERYVEVEQKVLYGAKRRAKRKMALTIIAASLAVVLLCSVFAAMSLGGRAPAFMNRIPYSSAAVRPHRFRWRS